MPKKTLLVGGLLLTVIANSSYHHVFSEAFVNNDQFLQAARIVGPFSLPATHARSSFSYPIFPWVGSRGQQA